MFVQLGLLANIRAVVTLQVHSRAVRITNTTKASAEGEIKASSSDRYIISPSSFRLKPGEAADLTISLRLEPKFAQRRKAIEIGQRDAIFIKVIIYEVYQGLVLVHESSSCCVLCAWGATRHNLAVVC
jgi:hypothetical protein